MMTFQIASSRTRAAAFTLMIMLAFICTSGCASEAGTPTGSVVEIAPTVTPDQTMFVQAWNDGPHADTYAPEKGPNTYCAKCHSPKNWDPSAQIDPPPNCVTCKFPFEEESRIANGNPLVPRADWESIGCETCHRLDNGHVNPEIAWYDNVTGFYETVADSNDLCSHCHLDNETLRHQRHMGTEAHAEFECVDCHNPHNGEAACGDCHTARFSAVPSFIEDHSVVSSNGECVECHAGAFLNHDMTIQQAGDDNCMNCHGRQMGRSSIAPIQFGHSGLHSNVQCVACHDSAGFAVEPMPEVDEWVTFRTTEFLGRSSTSPYQSHSIQLHVDCQRCHFPDNPWGLTSELDELSDESGS